MTWASLGLKKLKEHIEPVFNHENPWRERASVHDIFYKIIGKAPAKKGDPIFVWGHGWGKNHQSLLPLAGSFESSGQHILVDFPGFGQSPTPEQSWDTADYADAMAELIRKHTDRKIIWIGHSFGGRVGVQLAARHPNIVAGLFIIAGAGIPKKRSLVQKANLKIRITTFKLLKRLASLGLINQDWLTRTFGSADYKNAGDMRDIFINVIRENLSDISRNIRCKTCLVYGDLDTETPLDIGQAFHRLITGSSLQILPGQDHYSVLGPGRHQVAQILKNFHQDIKT